MANSRSAWRVESADHGHVIQHQQHHLGHQDVERHANRSELLLKTGQDLWHAGVQRNLGLKSVQPDLQPGKLLLERLDVGGGKGVVSQQDVPGRRHLAAGKQRGSGGKEGFLGNHHVVLGRPGLGGLRGKGTKRSEPIRIAGILGAHDGRHFDPEIRFCAALCARAERQPIAHA